jgi:predicted RNase H-like nuclease
VVLANDEPDGPSHRLLVCRDCDEVLTLKPRPVVVVVDIPIGLLDRYQPGGRVCDQEARRLLGPRRSSVFSPPIRPALRAATYAQARRFHLSRQTFGIVPKIREADQMMTPARQKSIHESHPESAFLSLAGEPMKHNKKRLPGRLERLKGLKRASESTSCRLFERIEAFFEIDQRRFPRRGVAMDDILDAYAMLWVAFRIRHGRADRLPADPPRDAKGLRMEIWH